MIVRGSLPTIKQLPAAFLVAMATALGGGAVAMFTSWWGGLVNTGMLDVAIEQNASEASRQLDSLKQEIGALRLELRPLNDAKLSSEMRVGIEVRERMAVEVGLHQLMRMCKLNEEQRLGIERSMINAEDRHETLVLRMKMTPEDAADRVVNEYKVRR